MLRQLRKEKLAEQKEKQLLAEQKEKQLLREKLLAKQRERQLEEQNENPRSVNQLLDQKLDADQDEESLKNLLTFFKRFFGETDPEHLSGCQVRLPRLCRAGSGACSIFFILSQEGKNPFGNQFF